MQFTWKHVADFHFASEASLGSTVVRIFCAKSTISINACCNPIYAVTFLSRSEIEKK
jgi:hypothetical protein